MSGEKMIKLSTLFKAAGAVAAVAAAPKVGPLLEKAFAAVVFTTCAGIGMLVTDKNGRPRFGGKHPNP